MREFNLVETKKSSRRLSLACNLALSFAAAFSMSVVASPGWAQEHGLSADIIEKPDRNTEIEIQNTADVPVTINSIVINRKKDDPMCHLTAFRDYTGDIWFARSDSSDEVLDAISTERAGSATLEFGDEISAVVYQGCGSILEVEVWVDEGRILFYKE